MLAGFVCFFVAMALYPGGGYDPLMQMLSVLGETKVHGGRYPSCHYWFMTGLVLSVANVMGVFSEHMSNSGNSPQV